MYVQYVFVCVYVCVYFYVPNLYLCLCLCHRFNSMDGRLERMLETSLMIMEALPRQTFGSAGSTSGGGTSGSSGVDGTVRGSADGAGAETGTEMELGMQVYTY